MIRAYNYFILLFCLSFFLQSCLEKKQTGNSALKQEDFYFSPDSSVYKINHDSAFKNGFTFKTNLPFHTKLELIRGTNKPAKILPLASAKHDTLEITSHEVIIPYDPTFDYIRIILPEKIQSREILSTVKERQIVVAGDTSNCACLFQYTINLWTASQKDSYVNPDLPAHVDLFIK